MSGALSEALVAAQRRAISALEKAYLAGSMDGDTLVTRLCEIGATDTVDAARLLAALYTIRELGAALPSDAVSNATGATETPPKASEAQLSYIAKLADEKGFTAPEGPFTKEQASEIITSLQRGTYDPAKWEIPF